MKFLRPIREYSVDEKATVILVLEILFAAIISFCVFLLALSVFFQRRVYLLEFLFGAFAISFFSLWLASIAFRKAGGRWLRLSIVLKTGRLFVIPYTLLLLEPLRKWFQVQIYY